MTSHSKYSQVNSNELDWNLLRSFLAVAEQGSLSAAARTLSSSQPTLGRHISELEERVGVGLFARHPRGLRLTDEGARLFERAVTVREGVDAFARRASGMDPGIDGTVRISASEVVAISVLPHILAELRRAEPAIELELVADNRSASLLRRDADIAVRMFRPTQPDLIARHVADSPLALYASDTYLAHYGAPESLDDLTAHTVVGLDRDDLHVRVLRDIGADIGREDFAIRCDNQPFHLQAAIAGLGISAVQQAIARRHPSLQLVLPEVTLPALPLWLVAHAELRRSPRVRRVFDALAKGLGAYYADEFSCDGDASPHRPGSD
ncbi:MAG: LysR family transcriptional regulator [Myxococcales bacterium]|nr:LysR family transcriptional regulator [Myxococcales bacterium]